VSFPRDVYRLAAVKKAAYKYTGSFSISIEVDNSSATVVRLVPKSNTSRQWPSLIEEFPNEVLDQDLRETIAGETSGVRDLILAQAFSEVSVFHPEIDRPSGQLPANATSNGYAEPPAEA